MRNPKQDTSIEVAGLRGQLAEPLSPPRWSLSASLVGLDVFWPILAVVLVVAVVFVASVAHSSMDSVGVPFTQIAAQPPKPTVATPVAGNILIVQVSSHATQSAADAAAAELIDRGLQARILDSDQFRPLNRGYFVVYLGPYPATAEGRAEAKQVQVRISGALLRTVRRR